MITYSEIFYSVQGEGKFCGRPTLWLRLFDCNLQCSGFGQKDPTDKSSYILPYRDFDVSSVDKIEDLPVWKYGCDSSYSWAKKYKHLAHKDTAENITEKLIEMLPESLKKRNWRSHLCFTGGEPLLPKNQKAVCEVLDEFHTRLYFPQITFETNGTQKLEPNLARILFDESHLLFSVSPKLFTVSGEVNEKAIRPDIVREYTKRGDVQLKFVLGDEDRQWEELNRVLNLYRSTSWDPDVWIMPVGATEDSQNDISGRVADRALKYGYSVAARVHTQLWGNKIGT